jgi:hypothetical protein
MADRVVSDFDFQAAVFFDAGGKCTSVAKFYAGPLRK